MKQLDKLNNQFEIVTLQLEKLENNRDIFIDNDKDTFSIDNKIYKSDDKQYQIQLKIEELEDAISS